MLSTATAVSVLRQLRPHTVVTTATGTALVLCQLRSLVTVLESGIVRVYERFEVYTDEDLAWFRRPITEVTDAALRGLGRQAYRNGALMHEAVTFAADMVGRELLAVERLLVCDGWVAERTEVVL